MPTALSSTRRPQRRPVRRRTRLGVLLRNEVRAVRDVGHLVRFRAGSIPRRRAAAVASVFLGVTVLAVAGPAFAGAAPGRSHASDVLTLLPTAFAAFQVLAIVSGIASGGGRELVPREELVAFPVCSTTDHLGALLLAPLNIAWLMESWLLLGMTAYGVGWSGRLLPAELAVLAWIAASTAVGQVVAWAVEGIRRTAYGPWLVRGLAVAVAGAFGILQVAHRIQPMLDSLPTGWFVYRTLFGFGHRWLLGFGAELGILIAATVVGAVPAHLASRILPRDELSAESRAYRARPLARSDFAMLVRIDRGSVWRSVMMRRGVLVLALGPGVVALVGGLDYSQLVILPGLVASGGALLFGVNAWSLDERGGLWRESLPVDPRTVFLARAWVLTEFLLLASVVTLLLGVVRAGTPTATGLVVLGCAWLVVTTQVVTAALRWSQRSPYAVDLSSARATPAPPLRMVTYSARMALATTVVGLVFQGLADQRWWQAALVLSGALLLVSAYRLIRLRDQWSDPVVRARVVTTVAL